MISIALVNRSTVVSDAEATKAAAALQVQISRGFAPIYGTDATVGFVGLNDKPAPPDVWQLVILDNSDQAGDLGYHDTTADGLPLGKVFAKDDIADGCSWSITSSHEILEMLADPNCDQTADVGAYQVAREVCDPCEDDQFGYEIDGVMVSDFVCPAWFMIGSTGPFDYGGHIPAPLQLITGGYESRLQNGQWLEVNARKGAAPTRHDRAMRRG